MIQPIGNKILVKPLHQDAVARQLVAAMKSDQRDYVQSLAEQMPEQHGSIVLVQTVPPVCGRVIAVGKPFCEECRQPVSLDVSVGDVVVYHASAGYEVSIDNVEHVILKPADVLLLWRADEGAV